MKVLKIIFSSALVTALLFSCATTDVESISSKEESNTASEPKRALTVVVSEPEPEPSAEDLFISCLEGVTLQFTSKPKIANVKRAFNGSYVLNAKDSEGTPLPEYPVTISYPVSKEVETIHYETIDVITDEKGNYTFTPSTPTFAASTKVTAYPTPVNADEKVFAAVMEHKAEADWKVKSDIISKGAVLFIWDFNEKNRPVNNSYDILSEFRTRGMSLVGNAPVNETSYIGKPLSTLYKENYEYIENSYGYLIVGTIKFTKPVEALESGDGYLCSLVAEIQAVTMTNGTKIFDSTFTHEATGKNWNACVSKCKEELAEEIVDALVYGL